VSRAVALATHRHRLPARLTGLEEVA
jgi:hypothetical protein